MLVSGKKGAAVATQVSRGTVVTFQQVVRAIGLLLELVVEEYLLSRKGLLFGRLICTALISCPRKVGHYSVLQARKVNPSLDINDILFVSLKLIYGELTATTNMACRSPLLLTTLSTSMVC